jgi:hypothetical protein
MEIMSRKQFSLSIDPLLCVQVKPGSIRQLPTKVDALCFSRYFRILDSPELERRYLVYTPISRHVSHWLRSADVDARELSLSYRLCRSFRTDIKQGGY